MGRHWKEILEELHDRSHDDGYYCCKSSLEEIVDELVEELTYVNLIEKEEIKKVTESRQSISHCRLEELKEKGE